MTAGRQINSQSQEWGTPRKYVNAVREFFGGSIELDPCSNERSIVHAQVEYRLPLQDGLRESWDFRSIYVNPPYGIDKTRGTSIKDWLKKCADAFSHFDSEVLALVPVATNTGHWKKYVFGRAACICFLYDTRLKFLVNGQNGGKGAPMACAIIYWGTRCTRLYEVFSKFGAVIDITCLQGKRFGYDSDNTTLELFETEVAA